MSIYNGVRAQVDGRTYELHYGSRPGEIRVYLIKDGQNRRRVDAKTEARVLEATAELRAQTEASNATIRERRRLGLNDRFNQ